MIARNWLSKFIRPLISCTNETLTQFNNSERQLYNIYRSYIALPRSTRNMAKSRLIEKHKWQMETTAERLNIFLRMSVRCYHLVFIFNYKSHYSEKRWRVSWTKYEHIHKKQIMNLIKMEVEIITEIWCEWTIFRADNSKQNSQLHPVRWQINNCVDWVDSKYRWYWIQLSLNNTLKHIVRSRSIGR